MDIRTETMPPFSAADPRPRGYDLAVQLRSGEQVEARIDTYSDRLRCDHPAVDDGAALADALKSAAREADRGRVVVLAAAELAPELRAADFHHEGTIPGFYAGEGDCAVLGFALDDARGEAGFAADVAAVDALIEDYAPTPRPRPAVQTERAGADDAPALAALIDSTFAQYPTPSGRPEYLARAIEDGIPFRLVREAGEVIACASADLVPEARTAELTDCATRPEHRGRGLMQAILGDLMDDLRALDYPTAFTLARARIAGVNLGFKRLGFVYRGRMHRSCRIGGGLEDMNIWSRRL